MKLTHAITVSMVLGLFLGFPALANESGSQPSRTGKCSVEINNPLTDAQKVKMGTIADEFDLETANLQAQLRVAHRQLFELLGNNEIDHNVAQNIETKIDSLRSEIGKSRIKMMLAMHDVFTPEQRAEMKTHMPPLPPPMPGMMPPFGGHGRFVHNGPFPSMLSPCLPMSIGLPGMPPPPFPQWDD